MKISRRSAYAVYGLRYLACQGSDRRVTVAEIADSVSLPEKHLAKVFMRLAKIKMVHSVRGMHGGFMLARPSEQISLLEIVEAVEGPFNTENCLLHFGACKPPGGCEVCGYLRDSQQAVMNILRKTKISDLMKDEDPRLHWEECQDSAGANTERQKVCTAI